MISPALGFLVAGILIIGIMWIVRHMRVHKVNFAFRKLQLLSAGAMAFTLSLIHI